MPQTATRRKVVCSRFRLSVARLKFGDRSSVVKVSEGGLFGQSTYCVTGDHLVVYAIDPDGPAREVIHQLHLLFQFLLDDPRTAAMLSGGSKR